MEKYKIKCFFSNLCVKWGAGDTIGLLLELNIVLFSPKLVIHLLFSNTGGMVKIVFSITNAFNTCQEAATGGVV